MTTTRRASSPPTTRPADIVIDSSVFADNGAGDGFSHNIYINHVRSFTLRDSYSTDARVGHLVKSRAARNYILYDRLSGEQGTDSYELDLPNGGLSYVIGTVLQQGPRTQNPNMLAYGEEGDLQPDSHLYVVNDTFVNDLGRGAAMLIGADVRTPLLAENDISVGSPVFTAQRGARLRHNCMTANARFVDRSALRLPAHRGLPVPARRAPAGLGAGVLARAPLPVHGRRRFRCAGPTAARSRARSARCSLTGHTMVTGEGLHLDGAATQPGGRPPAPGELALVQAFINSFFDLEGEWGADLFATPGRLAGWMSERGLLPAGHGPAQPRPGARHHRARGSARAGRGQQRRRGGDPGGEPGRAERRRRRCQRGGAPGRRRPPLRPHRAGPRPCAGGGAGDHRHLHAGRDVAAAEGMPRSRLRLGVL